MLLNKGVRWQVGDGAWIDVFSDPQVTDDENFFIDTMPLEGCKPHWFLAQKAAEWGSTGVNPIGYDQMQCWWSHFCR